MTRRLIFTICTVILFCCNYSFAEQSIQSIETRPGVTLTYMIHTPGSPTKGTLVLFGGSTGEGHFGASSDGIKLSDNFLARTSPDFVKRGYTIVLVGVPSDNPSGMTDSFRISQQHTADIQKLVRVIAEKFPAPIYIVGTSRGTLSAAHVAISVNDGHIKGLILTSSLESVGLLPLKRLTMPVLIIHHGQDDCHSTPYSAAYALKKSCSNSSRVNFVTVKGGSPGVGYYAAQGRKKNDGFGADPCKALSCHGFLGVEKYVVEVISDWLDGRPIPEVVGE